MRSKRIASAVLLAMLALLMPAASSQSSSSAKSPLVAPAQVSPFLRPQFAALGDRVRKAGNERVTLHGTFTDSAGTTQAQVVIELGGKVSVTWAGRPGQQLVFDGVSSKVTGAVTNPNDLLESLVDDLPENLLLAGKSGIGFRLIGLKFAAAGGMCDLYDVPTRGQASMKPAAQVKRYCFDSQTALLRWVQYFSGGTVQHPTVQHPVEVRTDFSKWINAAGQAVPGSIVRSRAGSQIFSFQVQTAVVSPAVNDNAFGH